MAKQWMLKFVDVQKEMPQKRVPELRARDFNEDTHTVSDLFTPREPRWKTRDTIVFVEKDSPKRWVHRPGRVIDIRKWSNGKKTYWFTYTEHQKGNRWAFEEMLRGRGRGWKKVLSRYGRMKADTRAEVSRWWNERGAR